jgi:hypothetical protein
MMRRMLRHSRRRCAGSLASFVVGLAMVLGAPAAAMAQEEGEVIDARLQGYVNEQNQPVNVSIPGASTALTWVLLIVLAVIGLGGMFKDAKRTHLD